MIEIIPAILPKSFEELAEGLHKIRGLSPVVQVDLVGTNVLVGHEALPFWEEFDFECDIMLPDPRRAVEVCLAVGAARIIVHANAPTAHEALAFLQDMRGGEFSISVGLALRAHDTSAVLLLFEGLYDYVQVMGIDHEGKQGEPFDEHSIDLVKKLRQEHPNLSIQVDGAAATHLASLVGAGANRLVVGSAIMSASDPRAVYKALYTEANVADGRTN
jgi:pentose-5-phosphate-3-epimerase